MSTPIQTLLDLTGRSALVTGGSRGLGLQIAEALGEAGAKILLTSRKAGDLEEAAAHLQDRGIDTRWIAADASQPAEIQRVADEAMQRMGHIDILVNNAGATWGAAMEDYPLEAWDKVMNLNIRSIFLMCQAIGRLSMIPRKHGRIINVASIAGLLGQDPRFAATAAYTATKHGLIGLTRQLAAEWGVHGITVNAICPGFFPSKMTRATLDTAGKLIQEWTPTRRLGGSEDLKGLAVLLASEASRHISGQAIAVDGGASVI
jgi:NAD(P)-dependent dehydrogenase (short-subunit alcohol dehydrogenase family)